MATAGATMRDPAGSFVKSSTPGSRYFQASAGEESGQGFKLDLTVHTHKPEPGGPGPWASPPAVPPGANQARGCQPEWPRQDRLLCPAVAPQGHAASLWLVSR